MPEAPTQGNWEDRYAPPEVPYVLPSGAAGTVRPHRLYIGPQGIGPDPYIARARMTTVRRWMPATLGKVAPPGAVGWVQLSRRFAHVGILHVPGMPARPVRVLELGTDPRGRTRALVRHRLPSAAEVSRNPTKTLVATRTDARRRRTRQRATEIACRVFPWASSCAVVRSSNPPAQRTWRTLLRELLLGSETLHATHQGLEIQRP